MASPSAPTSKARDPAPPAPAPDTLYAAPRADAPFRFDAEVARVFQDMVERSVPGYASLIHGVGLLGAKHAQPGTLCYDLGCSLGAVARALSARLGPGHPIVGIDASPDMIARCQRRSDPAIRYQCADIRQARLEPASLVVLNLTLQFLAPDDRLPLLQRIARALRPGGALILTEKIRFEEPLESRMQERYNAFKQAQGYSALEISQKRTALEQTLVRDSLADHCARLEAAGFNSPTIWFQCLHFTSMLALRRNGMPT